MARLDVGGGSGRFHLGVRLLTLAAALFAMVFSVMADRQVRRTDAALRAATLACSRRA